MTAAVATYVWHAWTLVLVAAFVVMRIVGKNAPAVERANLRTAGTFVGAHLLTTAIGAALVALGYDARLADIIGLAFLGLGFISIATTIAFRVALPRVGILLPRILIDLITGALVIVAFIVVGRRAGFSIAGLITTSAVLTAVIGFSLQDTLGSVMGGLSVQMDKSIKVGDWISMGPGQPTGRVSEIRWRYTAIETRNWDTVIIPNGMLVKSQITIFGRRVGAPVQTRRTVEFNVDFRTPPTDVITAVEAALRKDPVQRMATEPPPHVLFHGVKDSYGLYIVRYWLDDLAVDDPPDSDVRTRIWYALTRAGIPLSIPASAVFLTNESDARDDRKASEELDQRRTALASVDLFRALPAATRDDLAKQLVYAPFAAGETVTHEGARDDGLYMIVRGDAVVCIGAGPTGPGSGREVARLQAGQFFGEMSLMTGEARTASVVAASNLVCYRVDKPAFQRILRDTPSVADQIAEVLVARRASLTAARDEREEVKRDRADTAKHDLLGRIRGFFGIAG